MRGETVDIPGAAEDEWPNGYPNGIRVDPSNTSDFLNEREDPSREAWEQAQNAQRDFEIL
jgi:hypothetical protein